jgi:hypothetical protein
MHIAQQLPACCLMQAISAHVESLRQWTYGQLLQLRHSNGQPLVRVFGHHAEGPQQQGGIFQFQVRLWSCMHVYACTTAFQWCSIQPVNFETTAVSCMCNMAPWQVKGQRILSNGIDFWLWLLPGAAAAGADA